MQLDARADVSLLCDLIRKVDVEQVENSFDGKRHSNLTEGMERNLLILLQVAASEGSSEIVRLVFRGGATWRSSLGASIGWHSPMFITALALNLGFKLRLDLAGGLISIHTTEMQLLLSKNSWNLVFTRFSLGGLRMFNRKMRSLRSLHRGHLCPALAAVDKDVLKHPGNRTCNAQNPWENRVPTARGLRDTMQTGTKCPFICTGCC